MQEPFPLWGGDANFTLGLDSVVGQPFAHPERYHHRALPVRRLVAIYGSAGAQKRRVLAAYCLGIGCPKLIVKVESALPADLEAARTALDECMAPKDSPYGVDAVIIVNHAQYFQRDPHALGWAAKAEAANVVLLALFDSVPSENPEFRGLFYKASLYLRPPETTAMRVAQMRWHVEHYMRECKNDKVRFTLSDDEWTQLSDVYTQRASPRQLKHYVQALIYHALQTNEPITYALATSRPFVTSAGGEGDHIVPRALNTEENVFSVAAGQGPINLVPAIKPPPPRAIKKQKIEEANPEEPIKIEIE
jgi:hypothetical protein